MEPSEEPPGEPPEDPPGDPNAIPGARALVGYRIEPGAPGTPPRVWLDVDDRHANRNGFLHGGIIAMLLDAAGGFAASKHFGGGRPLTPLVTLTLNTSFVAGARIGDRVTAIGVVTGGGRRIAYANAELRAGDGTLIATAQGAFRAITQDGDSR